MTYVAIARKYRPSTLGDMVGQDHVTATLAHAIERGRVHHAYLFCGARGVGKTTAARALARALNCAEGPTISPCGVCPSCRDILAGSSPDLIEIDGASNNSVDDVRELRESVRYRPTGGRYKIFLVDEVHMLSKAAFNALLKTLEEPPPHVLFLFATTEPEKLPETILSRVQRFDFKRIGTGGVVDRLRGIAAAEGVEVAEGGLRLIAQAAEGSMRDAQSLLDKVLAFGDEGKVIDEGQVAHLLGLVDRRLLHDALTALLAGDAPGCIGVVAVVHELGFEPARFVAELMQTLRDATFLRLSEELRRHVDLPGDEVQRLLAATEGVEPERLTRLFAALVEVHDQVARAPRPLMLLEMAMVRLASVKPVVPLAPLVQRLEQLERRLRQGGGAVGAGAPPRRPMGPASRAPTRPAPAPRRAPAPEPLDADLPDEARWASWLKALAACEPPVTAFEGAVVRRDGATVVVAVRGGRKLAEARRALGSPEVSALVEACYGRGARLRVEESLASRRAGVDPALERMVQGDPVIQGVQSVLGAVLVDVSPEEVAS